MRSNPKEWKRVTTESPYRNAAILTSRFRDGDYAGVPGHYEADEEKGKKKKSYFIFFLFPPTKHVNVNSHITARGEREKKKRKKKLKRRNE